MTSNRANSGIDDRHRQTVKHASRPPLQTLPTPCHATPLCRAQFPPLPLPSWTVRVLDIFRDKLLRGFLFPLSSKEHTLSFHPFAVGYFSPGNIPRDTFRQNSSDVPSSTFRKGDISQTHSTTGTTPSHFQTFFFLFLRKGTFSNFFLLQ